jgi:hypothetical protein
VKRTARRQTSAPSRVTRQTCIAAAATLIASCGAAARDEARHGVTVEWNADRHLADRLAPSLVAEAVAQSRDVLAACWERPPRDAAPLGDVEMTVAPDGSTSRVRLRGEPHEPAVVTCIKREVSSWHFPAMRGPAVGSFALGLVLPADADGVRGPPPSRPAGPAERPRASAMERCLRDSDYARCIVRELDGRVSTASERVSLLEAHRVLGDRAAMCREMVAFLRDFPRDRRVSSYRQVLLRGSCD